MNGRTIPIDQISAEGDIGPYLKAGPNTIAVRVATTLNNRLAKIDEDVANRGLVQPYGLVGPVRLIPLRHGDSVEVKKGQARKACATHSRPTVSRTAAGKSKIRTSAATASSR